MLKNPVTTMGSQFELLMASYCNANANRTVLNCARMDSLGMWVWFNLQWLIPATSINSFELTVRFSFIIHGEIFVTCFLCKKVSVFAHQFIVSLFIVMDSQTFCYWNYTVVRYSKNTAEKEEV